MDECQYLKIFWLAVIGAALGSFLNCAASRSAAGRNPFAGRSCCVDCGETLAARDLLPIFSYLWNRGRCRFCGTKIPLDCLAAELAGAVVLLAVGLNFNSVDELGEMGQWLCAAALALGVALWDWHGRVIPDKLLLLLLLNRAVWFCLLETPLEERVTERLFALLFSLLVPVSLLIIVLLAEMFWQREVMGGGDIKLLLVLAFYFSWAEMLLILLAGCFLGLLGTALLRKWQDTLPFGLYLTLAAGLTLCWGAPLIDWYLMKI